VADPLASIRGAFRASGRDFDKLSHTARMQSLDKITDGSPLLAAIVAHGATAALPPAVAEEGGAE
jgi:hypothetical protein